MHQGSSRGSLQDQLQLPPAQSLPLPSYPGNVSAYQPEILLPTHTSHTPRPNLKRRGAGKFLRIILAILIGVAIIFLIVIKSHMSDSEQATARAEEFMIAMQSNQPDRAYAMGNESFRKATTEEALGGMFDQVEPFLSGARIDQADAYYAESAKGDPRAIVVFTATKGSKTTYVRLVMERQHDVWYAHSLLSQVTPLYAKPE